jgi:hypothetical protein
MAQLMDLIAQVMGGDTKRQIGRQLGADDQTTEGAISAALPMLLTALARNSSNPQGADALHQALARDHDGSILDDFSGSLARSEAGPGAGILRHVLGERQPLAQQAVAQSSGLDAARAGQLLMMLAPVVMGALGRSQRSDNMDASGLADMLGHERQQLGQSSPDLAGLATRLLDRDGDGSIAEELSGIAGKLFGGR